MSKLVEKVEKQIAQEDIKTVKVLRDTGGEFHAYFQRFKYEFGKLYKTKLHVENLGYVRIDKGFHSYNDTTVPHVKTDGGYIGTCTKIDPKTCIQVTNSIGQLLACYTSALPAYNVVLVECTIPKGSEYWVNDDGEVVSNMIIINKVLE
jgi:hypothetical protein